MVESIRLAVGYARVSLEEENVENQVRAIEDITLRLMASS